MLGPDHSTKCSLRGVTRLLIVALGASAIGFCGEKSPSALSQVQKNVAPDKEPEGIQVPPPPFTEGIFPCKQCHDGKTVKLNTTRRKLVDMHDDITLKHGPESRWCLDCHDAKDRDHLHLVNRDRVDFSQSYVLCGQCHGDKFRDWKVGVHGKRTGSWNGQKQYLLCVHCHNPHAPHFKPLSPMPAPQRPESIGLSASSAKLEDAQ